MGLQAVSELCCLWWCLFFLSPFSGKDVLLELAWKFVKETLECGRQPYFTPGVYKWSMVVDFLKG